MTIRAQIEPCPVCMGRGQITGPKSLIYEYDPGDPFNVEVRLCDECDGRGLVTAARAAGIHAEALQKVLPIVDQVMQEHDPRHRGAVKADAERWAREMGLRS